MAKEIKAGVIYNPVKCPECESKNVRRYKTVFPVRYYKCNDCQHNFKAIEAK